MTHDLTVRRITEKEIAAFNATPVTDSGWSDKFRNLLTVTIPALLETIEEQTEEIAEWEMTHELMRKREQPWIERWREEKGKPLTLPDYGEIMQWLMDKAERGNNE